MMYLHLHGQHPHKQLPQCGLTELFWIEWSLITYCTHEDVGKQIVQQKTRHC